MIVIGTDRRMAYYRLLFLRNHFLIQQKQSSICFLLSKSVFFVISCVFYPAFSDPNNTKFILDRIDQAEKYLGTICVQFGKVCRKEARLRDCNDQLVEHMCAFAGGERINTSLRQSLQQYANYLSAVEDYRNTLVRKHL